MTTPRKIAIRSYGKYGSALLDVVCRRWADVYEVTAVFDVRFNELNAARRCPLKVSDPADLSRLYDAGVFEAVVIANAVQDHYHRIESEIAELGIPILTLAGPEALLPAAELAVAAQPRFALDDEGYFLAACRGGFGFVDMHGEQELVVFHDGAGHVARDIWVDDDLYYDPVALNFPHRVDAPPSEPVVVPGEWLATCRLWAHNYGHFTLTVLDQISVMEHAGYSGGYLMARSPFAAEIVALLGLSERVLWVDELDPAVQYLFEMVYFLHQDGFTYYAGTAAAPLGRVARVIEESACSGEDAGLPQRVFVRRIGARRLLGSDQVAERYGFATIVPEELPLVEQIRHFHAAKVVLSPHGANSANVLYMRRGSTLVETFGRGWGLPTFVHLAAQKGVHYVQVAGGDEIGGTAYDSTADYTLDDTLLEMAIANALALADDGEGID